MKYSIIIPTYNKCDELLKPCLESIIKYTLINSSDFVEIIVVANGCVDNTEEYVKSLQERFPNINLLVSTEPMGYTKAVNWGIKESKGDYVVLLNNDTQLLGQKLNEWLSILNRPFVEDVTVGITGPMKVPNDGTGLPFLIFFCVMIDRDVFKDIGYLDEIFSPGYGEDTDFCLRAEKAGWKVVQVPVESNKYYEPNRMEGQFPIYHAGNQTFKDYPDADLIHRNNQILIDKYSPKPVDSKEMVEVCNKIAEMYCGKVNIEAAKKCDGYMSDSELEWLADLARRSKVFIEIGSWHGKSSRAIADNLSYEDSVLYCVDHWRGSEAERDNNHQSAAWEDGDHAYLEFCENMADHILSGKVIPLRLSSKNAAKFLRNRVSADAIFIDGGHTKPEVLEDILDWLPLLNPTGTICGHDMYHVNNTWPGVGEAVTSVFKDQVRQAPNTSIWVVEGPNCQPSLPTVQETTKPAIIDCFPFNDELDILEIRFNELYDVVDRFVIVEAKLTHGGKPKGLNFHTNLARFEKFLNKVTYIVIEAEEFPALDSWSIERFQRNAIMRALVGCHDQDVIIISDCDEIPRAEVVKNYRREQGLCCVSQRLYYYNLNCQSGEAWNWLRILPYSLMKTMTPCEVRYTVNYKLGEQQIGEGGWHFSYMGNADKIISKIQDSAHQEYNIPQYKDRERVEKIIKEGRDLYDRPIPFSFVEIDNMYPKYVVENLKTFKEKGLVR